MDEDNHSILKPNAIMYSDTVINMTHISQSFATHHQYCNHDRIRKRYHKKRQLVSSPPYYIPWKRIIGFDIPSSDISKK